MPLNTQPTRGGQAVCDIRTGRLGITTGPPMSRTPSIGVIFLGSEYDVRAQLEDLEVVHVTFSTPTHD